MNAVQKLQNLAAHIRDFAKFNSDKTAETISAIERRELDLTRRIANNLEKFGTKRGLIELLFDGDDADMHYADGLKEAQATVENLRAMADALAARIEQHKKEVNA
jgi:hypothetical protein